MSKYILLGVLFGGCSFGHTSHIRKLNVDFEVYKFRNLHDTKEWIRFSPTALVLKASIDQEIIKKLDVLQAPAKVHVYVDQAAARDLCKRSLIYHLLICLMLVCDRSYTMPVQ